ncbi:MAG: UvrD-helicase domain-containing protein [Pirellulales bacterium]
MSHGLNPAQEQAVHTLRGPLLVLAGAGSGKTRVVTFRIAELIKHGTVPNRILAVTFTNKAAAEMQERVSELLGKRRKQKPQISTFHSHCVRVLRRHITRLGYPEKFAIYDRGDQESIARQVLREIKVPNDLMRPGDLLHQIGTWKTHAVRPPEAASQASNDNEHLAAMGYRRYQKSLQLAGAVDFDDLLLLSEELLTRFPDVRQAEAGLFDHLLVDEYQDTNGTQYRIVKALAQRHRNLCVVGDDDQSIYGWRGAEVEHILRFSHDWPDARVIRLEHNYRSTAAILDLANKLIVFNKKRHDKVLRAARPGGERPRIEQHKDEATEAQMVAADIARRLKDPGVEARDFAILFRTNEQPRAFESELRRLKLPYILVGGMSFFDRKEVRDLLAYLKVIDTPRDEVSLLRIINTPPRGIGAKTVETLLAHAVSQAKPLWDVLHQLDSVQLPAAAQTAVGGLVKLIEQYQTRAKRGPYTPLLRQLIVDIGYEDELRRIYPDPEEQSARWASVEEVVNALANYERRTVEEEEETPTLSGFLDELLLSTRDTADDKEKQLRRNAIALMTLHAAKGLEFPNVYMVGLEEGILPHHRSVAAEGDAIDEERRLCYVGITRAQERLTLSLALTRMKWGKPRDTIPSRFLFEVTGQAENFAAVAAAKKEAERRANAAERRGSSSGKISSQRSSPSTRPKGNKKQ